MRPLAALQSSCADEEKAVAQAERRSHLVPWSWSEDRHVQPVRDDVNALRVEAVGAARIGELLTRGDHGLTVAEYPPIALGEVAPSQREKTTLLAKRIDGPTGVDLSPNTGLDDAEEVAMEHDAQGCPPLCSAADKLERTRALPVDDVERLHFIDTGELGV